MAKISKFVKLDKDVLLEYVYNDGNLISDKYKVLTDSRNRKISYMAGDTSATGNNQINQLFNLDLTEVKYGKIDPTFYTYLLISDYSATTPIRHDTLKLHLPINWTFGEHLGFYIKVYTFDSTNTLTYNISNFFFDMTDTSQQKLMQFSAPPLLFQEKLWGKSVDIEIPAVSQISAQLSEGSPKANSINQNLTGGLGLSSTSPIMIDFFFIDGIQRINGITTYTLGQKVTTSLPQNPEFESLGLKIEHSVNGDFFEIYGTYNDNISEFRKFIEDSVRMGNKYYVQYDITMYEQNVRGKTMTVTVNDNFNESIEYRPIIKVSTTTAIIDVEMRLIDQVDDSYLLRRASYGMLQDEVSKYSANMTKINLTNALKPKIYNIKNNIDPSLLGKTNSLGLPLGTRGRTGRGINVGIAAKKGQGLGLAGGGGGLAGAGAVQTIKVPYAILVDKNNIIGKSENQVINKDLFYGIGKMEIFVYPFDNILKFILASGDSTAQTFLDLSGFGEIKLVFKNDSTTVEFGIMQEALDIDLSQGQLAFKIPVAKINSLKTIYNSGINLFYITATAGSNTTVVYTGLFKIYDNAANVNNLNLNSSGNQPAINQDPNLPKQTAVVTLKPITSSTDPNKKP